MTDAEYHQQQLEQQEWEENDTVVEFGNDGDWFALHIWGENENVFVNVNSPPAIFNLILDIEQAEDMVDLLTNALRRAKK